jgi:hypothetical protein
VAVISRMIIVPLLMLPILAVIAKYDLFEAAEDPVFILSAVLLVSSVSIADYSYRMKLMIGGIAPCIDTSPNHTGSFR